MNTDKTNSFWLATNFILLAVISVITLKMNIEHFGKEQFGTWIILSSIWGFGSTLDFGFGTTIIKYVSEYKFYYPFCNIVPLALCLLYL